MKTVIHICIALLLLTASVSIAALAWFGCIAIQRIEDAATDVAHATTKTLDAVNAPCVPGKACGTLADVNRTLATIRGTVGQIELAARHENKQLSTLDAQERQLFADLHGTLTETRSTLDVLRGTADAATATIQSVGRTVQQADPLLASATLTARDLDAKISDPHVEALLSHLDATSAHVDGVTGDVQRAVHRVTDPAPCTGRFCWIKVPAKVIWSLRDLPEPVYYLHELLP